MDFMDLVKRNRSYRGYDESKKVTYEQLLQMVECARNAPSGANRQPLKYFLSYKPETNAVIQPNTLWAAKLKDKKLPYTGHMPTAFIVICVDTKIAPDKAGANTDVGIAAQTILLAATSMGLGGCMIGAFKPSLKADLRLPDNISPALVIALGTPDETVVLEDAADSIDYYRDSQDIHHVPKRKLSDIILN